MLAERPTRNLRIPPERLVEVAARVNSASADKVAGSAGAPRNALRMSRETSSRIKLADRSLAVKPTMLRETTARLGEAPRQSRESPSRVRISEREAPLRSVVGNGNGRASEAFSDRQPQLKRARVQLTRKVDASNEDTNEPTLEETVIVDLAAAPRSQLTPRSREASANGVASNGIVGNTTKASASVAAASSTGRVNVGVSLSPSLIGENTQEVAFNVAGKIFRMSKGLVMTHPDGKLAELVRQAGDSSARSAIFLDGNPDRFPYILDWYQEGEIHVPPNVPIVALLLDAKRLGLPEEIVINGVGRTASGPAAAGVGQKVARDMAKRVLDKWPTFNAFFVDILGRMREHFREAADNSALCKDGEEAYDFPPHLLPLCKQDGSWVDTQNVCNGPRARVLAIKLEACGYECEFSDYDLIVSLPMKLQAEMMSMPPLNEEPEEPALEQST